jgi:hypothetical protein
MTTLPAAGYISDPARTNAEAKQAFEDAFSAVRQSPGGAAETTLTIASGAVTPTKGIHAIDTEAAAATDDLANVAQTNLPDGSLLAIRGANAGRVVTVRHGAGGIGQLLLADGNDLVLRSTSTFLVLKRTGTSWEELTRSPFASSTLRARVLINGGFDLAQRGADDSASFAIAPSTTAYTADRWFITAGASQSHTVSLQPGFVTGARNCIRLQRDAGQTGVGAMVFGQPLTTRMLERLRGRIVTIQAWIRSGANWSPASGNLTIRFDVGTGAQGKRGAGFTSETAVCSNTAALGTSSAATFLSATSAAAVPTTATQGQLSFTWTPAGTAGAADYVEIAQAAIWIGGQSQAWEPADYDEELRRAQAYFWKTFPRGTAPAQNAGVSGALSGWQISAASTAAGIAFALPVPMIKAGSGTLYNPSTTNAQVRNAAAGADASASAITAPAIGGTQASITFTTAAGSAGGQLNQVHATIDAEI